MMGKLSIVSLLLLVAGSLSPAMAARPYDEKDYVGQKHWPDFNCHPKYDEDSWRPGSLKINRENWFDCKDIEAKEGHCAKLCLLRYNQLIYHERVRTGPVTFKWDMMANYLANENGYKGLKGDARFASEKRMNAITEDMKACNEKFHKEIKDWILHEKCDRWIPLLTCIEKAYECKANY